MKTIQEYTVALSQSLKQVFSHLRYVALAIATFFVVVVLAIWLPNLSFVAHTAVSPSLALSQKVGILTSSLGAIETNFTPLSRALTLAVAALFAVQVSVMTFYLTRRVRLQKVAGMSGLGIVSGFLGIGCAACGSVIFSTLFGVGATASFIGVLPFKGQEFSFLSIVILGLSLVLTTKKIQDPLTCAVEPVA